MSRLSRLLRGSSPAAPPAPPPAPLSVESVEFAWRVHTAQEAWTGKVDTKASILLALEGGVLFAVVSANGKDGVLAGLRGWRQAVEFAGVGTLLLALAFAAAAVYPLLGSARTHVRVHADNVVYFGHLRHWAPAELRDKFGGLGRDEQLAILSAQVVAMSKRTWRKHRMVQASVVLVVVGVVLFSVAGLF